MHRHSSDTSVTSDHLNALFVTVPRFFLRRCSHPMKKCKERLMKHSVKADNLRFYSVTVISRAKASIKGLMQLNGDYFCGSFSFQIVVDFPRSNYMKTSVK